MEERAPEDEWIWNTISRCAIAYSCGMICRKTESYPHNHPAEEISLCQRLSVEASAVMSGHIMYGDEGEHEFLPFYVAANKGVFMPDTLDEDAIRLAFEGTIYPFAEVVIQPLSDWVEEAKDFVEQCMEDDHPDFDHSYIFAWNRLIDWFAQKLELDSPVFVSIDISDSARRDDPDRSTLDSYNGGCVFPRMAVALTQARSLVGIFSCVVHT
ncbi:MAG: hypothetical protein AAFQ63_20930 [Cyanobacteria bacterium J06621_11]